MLLADHGEEPLRGGPVDRETVHVAFGDPEVDLGEHHRRVRQCGSGEARVAIQPSHLVEAAGGLRALERSAESEPSRKRQSALAPSEHPGDRAEVVDAVRSGSGGRAAPDVESGDLAHRGDRSEEAGEVGVVVNERPVGAMGGVSEEVHEIALNDRVVIVAGSQGRGQCRRHKGFEVACSGHRP